MFSSKILKEQDGITLIELVVTLAIVTVAVGAILLIFVSGMNIFSSGSSHYDIQGNARLASQYITEELRYAVEIEILDMDNVPEEVNLNDNNTIPIYQNYLYYDSSTGAIRRLNRFDEVSMLIGNDGYVNFSSELTGKILKYTVLAKDDSKVYNIENEINILNLHLGGVGNELIKTNITDGNDGIILRYVTISDYLSATQLPVIEIGEINNSKAIQLRSDTKKITNVVPNMDNSTVDEYPNISYPDNYTTTLEFTKAVKNNDKLEIMVYFSGWDADMNIVENTYIYTLTYSNQNYWTITGISG